MRTKKTWRFAKTHTTLKRWRKQLVQYHKRWRTFLSRVNTPLLPPVILGISGLLLMFTTGAHWYLRWQSLRLDPSVRALYTQEQTTRPPAPIHVAIPWRVDVAVEPQVYTADGQWTISPNSASYWMQSARPGENGNIVIYGHNTKENLGNLRAMYAGAEVTLTTDDGQTHVYEVTEWHETQPNDTSWLKPTETETLTLYTCSGFLDSLRFVVRAVRKE